MIAINSTTAIEQNGATGDGDGLGGDEVRYRTIPLNRVAGLLRKKGNNVAGIPDSDNWFWRMDQLMYDIRGRNITREEFRKNFVGVEPFHMVEIIQDSPEKDRARVWQQIGETAQRDNWQGQIQTLQAQFAASEQALRNREKQALEFETKLADLTKTVTDLQARVEDTGKALIIKDNEIERLKKEAAVVSQDTELLNGFGVWLQKIIIRLGVKKGQ
jgi:hypothetical protein